MDWYLMVWKKYGEFNGRARRTEFWMFMLVHFFAILGLGILAAIGTAIRENYGAALFIPICLYFLAAIVPNLAVTVRRFHDTGKSGAWVLLFILLNFVPLIGFISGIIQIVMLCQDSDPGTNEYGPSPKFRGQAGAFAGNVGYLPMEFGAPPQPVTVETQTHQNPTDS